MSKYILAITLLLVLDSCTVSRYFNHTQEAPPKYRNEYRHHQRKNSRRRPTNSYAEGYYQGKTEWLAQ